MKGVLKFLVLFLLFTYLNINSVEAHSGRTDSSGGHNCSPKSVAKGLCSGYHYHNGGGTTNTAPAPAKTVYNPKVYYDKGYQAGYDKGHEMGYKKDSSIFSSTDNNSDYIEGWSAGYQKGLEDGLNKIKKEEKDAKDKKDGEEKGKKDGATSFSAGKNNNDYSYSSGSSELYIIAYKEAFTTSWQIEKSRKDAFENGYEQGLLQDEIVIPTNFETDILRSEYEKGHKEGVNERDKNEMIKYEKEGHSLGYDVKEFAVPADLQKEIYIDALKQGYEAGLQKRKEEIVKEGYTFAFKQMKYENNLYEGKKHFSNWFKEGYESNDVAAEIKIKAIKLGKENKEYTIPEKYKVNADAIALYDKLFLEGQKIQKEENRKTRATLMAAGVIGFPTVGGIYYWTRKRKKKIE
ncbi:YHYH domain-containing protein [Bacillus sp. FJAT-29790]|uniref:YHYH domain-containing protein n=1 Tax=Bacillus sp. FJAT-29790 TaxID=1895002 RepID=UPI001C211F49|nr:YHYH domain-containing protein [Bacillus sp. FJAT-29790]MBU8877967.1 YHYH domain-containing protein [Bacillus sp. FJAT-29790]